MKAKRFLCRKCRRYFQIRVPGQQYCGSAECQKARKNAWRREKYASDRDYRLNQKQSTEAWLLSKGGSAEYYRRYRKRKRNGATQLGEVEAAVESVLTQATEIATGPVVQPGTEIATRQVTQPGTEIATGPVVQPGTEIATGPVVQPGTEMATGQVVQPSVEIGAEPAMAKPSVQGTNRTQFSRTSLESRGSANSDALFPDMPIKAGRYLILPEGANRDTFIAEIRMIQNS